MEQKATITALVVTYNAERFIRGCLESVKWADEIILVDMLSSDKTVEIARRYTDRIFLEGEENHEIRTNIGINKSTSDWILKLNATERITVALKNEILEKINSNYTYAGYCIPRLNYLYGRFIMERPGTLYLFKRGSGEYPCKSGHEKILLNGKASYLKNFKIHYSAVTIEELISKWNSYTSNDAKSVFNGKAPAFGTKLPVFKANFFTLLFRSLCGFFSVYIFGRGYKYGMHGFTLAVLSACFHFVEIAKLWELQYKKKHDIRDELSPVDDETELSNYIKTR